MGCKSMGCCHRELGRREKGLVWGEGGYGFRVRLHFLGIKRVRRWEQLGKRSRPLFYMGIMKNRLGSEACFVRRWVGPEGLQERKAGLVSFISTTPVILGVFCCLPKVLIVVNRSIIIRLAPLWRKAGKQSGGGALGSKCVSSKFHIIVMFKCKGKEEW